MSVNDCGLNRVELMLLLYGAGFLQVQSGEVKFDQKADPGSVGGKLDLMRVAGRQLAHFFGEAAPGEEFRYVAVESDDEPLIPGFIEACGIEGIRFLKLDRVEQRGVTNIFPTSSSFKKGARVLLLGLSAGECHGKMIEALRNLGLTVDHCLFLVSNPAGGESIAEASLGGLDVKIGSYMRGNWILTGLQNFDLI